MRLASERRIVVASEGDCVRSFAFADRRPSINDADMDFARLINTIPKLVAS